MGQWDLIFCKNNCFATKILSQTMEQTMHISNQATPWIADT